jgi:N-acetylneuraminic acid mutarotase
MNRQRSGAGVVAHGQYIYIAGGMDNSGYLNSMERYDTDKDVWIPLSPMPTARSALTLAVLENQIYAIGGYAHFFQHSIHSISTLIRYTGLIRFLYQTIYLSGSMAQGSWT